MTIVPLRVSRGAGLRWCTACLLLLTALDAENCGRVSAADDGSSCPGLTPTDERQNALSNPPEELEKLSLIQMELRMDGSMRMRSCVDLLEQESSLQSQQDDSADAEPDELAAIQIHHHAKERVRLKTNTGMYFTRSGHLTARVAGSTFICIAVSVFLAAVAVVFYVRSLMCEDKLKGEDRVARDDSEMSIESSASRRRLYRRRATLTPEDLQRPFEQKWIPEVAESTMSSKAFVVNMFADLCAPGLLPLAYGMTGTGFLPAAIMLVVFYGMCLYTMWLIGRTCSLSTKLNFADIWAQEIGPRSAWIPIVVVLLVCFGACLSYACFYADIFSGVMPALGLPLSRSTCLLIFTIFPTMPLCLMKDLSALAPSSFCALIAVIYTTIVMVLRLADSSYAPGGQFFDPYQMPATPLQPSDHMSQIGLSSLVLVNNMAMAFLAHYNGCKYYRELENHTPKYLVQVSSAGMGISMVIFAITGACGYLTFGDHSDGVILNNYSQNDWPINIARIGIGVSIIVSMPLMMSGLREAVLALFKFCAPDKQETFELVTFQDALTCILITMITAVTWVLTDTGLVVGVAGAVCGISIIYIIPCTLYAKTLMNLGAEKHTGKIALAICGAMLGSVLAVFGLLTSLGVLG